MKTSLKKLNGPAGWMLGTAAVATTAACAVLFLERPASIADDEPQAVTQQARVTQLAEPSTEAPRPPQEDEQDGERALHAVPLLSYVGAEEAASHLSFLKPEQLNDGRVLIRYASNTVTSLREGDAVDILLPETGIAMRGHIDTVNQHGEATRWYGSWSDAAGPGRFVISQTADGQYAHAVYETAMGTYSMEAIQGYGWIQDQASSAKLLANGQDFMMETSAH